MAEGIAASATKVKQSMGRLNSELKTTATASLDLDFDPKPKPRNARQSDAPAAIPRTGGNENTTNINITVNGNISSRRDAETMAEKLDGLIAARRRAKGVVTA
jgi:hypothetical protein